MIDTVKIYTSISKEVYNIIYNQSIIKSSINKKDGELLYEIVNDHLEGSYSSKLSVRVGCAVPCIRKVDRPTDTRIAVVSAGIGRKRGHGLCRSLICSIYHVRNPPCAADLCFDEIIPSRNIGFLE